MRVCVCVHMYVSVCAYAPLMNLVYLIFCVSKFNPRRAGENMQILNISGVPPPPIILLWKLWRVCVCVCVCVCVYVREFAIISRGTSNKYVTQKHPSLFFRLRHAKTRD